MLLPIALSCIAAVSLSSSASTAPVPAADRVTARSEVVRFDPDRLAALRVGDPLPKEFASFGGAGLRLVAKRSVRDASHLLFEDPANQRREASLLLREGRVTGTIALEGTLRTALDSHGRGVSRVRVVDAGDEPACGMTDEMRVGSAPAEGGIAGATTCDDGSVVDVFVAYTAAARAQAGGDQQIADAILWAIGDSNAIYASSGIPIELRLVGTLQSDYVENESMVTDVYQLRDPADGLADDALAAGIAARADLVALVRADGGGACGVAFLIGGAVEDVDWAVSVTALGCFPNKTFTHELGHNMGCCHAPGDGGGCLDGGVFPYSTGHRFNGQSGDLYRTVMAYAPGTRIGRFSSPDVLFDGTPTGIADERDNARTISETRFVITNFRCSTCAEDFDASGTVDAADLAVLLGQWGSTGDADLNADGTVDAADLATLLGAWGDCG